MKNVLLFSPYAFWKLHALYEVGLFHHFKHRGLNADYIHCDGVFGECDLYWEATVGPRPACACEVCQREVNAFLKQYHLPVDPLGAYTRPEEKLCKRYANPPLTLAKVLLPFTPPRQSAAPALQPKRRASVPQSSSSWPQGDA